MKIPYGVLHAFVTCHFRDLPGNHLEHLGVFPDFSKMAATFLHANGIYIQICIILLQMYPTVDLLTNDLKA
jgi:hypothetical protein